MSDLSPGGLLTDHSGSPPACSRCWRSPTGLGRPKTVRRSSDGAYELPAGNEIVIRIAENNGSVSPEFQTGYAVEIDSSGHAEYIFTPEGASGDMTDTTPEPQVTTADLGEDGLQALLKQLDTTGVFDLANPDDEPSPGASVDVLEVTLDDGTWLIQNVDLADDAATQLDLAQALIVATVRAGAAAG